MSDTEEDVVPPSPARSGYLRLFAVAGLTVLALIAIVASAFAIHGSVQGQYEKKDDAFRALAIRTDVDKKKTATAANVAQQHAVKTAVTDAVAREKKRADRVVRRVVRRMKVSARRKMNEAYKKGQHDGYSSGSAAGYSAGNDAGFSQGTEAGLLQGSDDLVCSDDPDVSWLPFC